MAVYYGGGIASIPSPDRDGPTSERSFGGREDGSVYHPPDPEPTHAAQNTANVPLHETPQPGTSRAEFNDAQYVNDMRAAFSAIPRIKPSWSTKYFKMLIVGDMGLGKTTFVRNLFAAYAQDPHLKVNDSSAPTSRDDFVSSPEKLCTEIEVLDNASQTRFLYRVQDSPGYDQVEKENMGIILDYVKSCNEAYLHREQDAKRAGPLHEIDDPRVDVCIYFLAPHRVKPIDLKFMEQLSALVPVVPVLAKADSMTTDELNAFRSSVRQNLIHASKGAKRAVDYPFSDDALREAGARPGVPPFAVVGANTMDESVGRFWPVRVYPWGTCEALSSSHSDMAALKKLLFEVCYTELKQNTEQKYYVFRESSLVHLDDPHRPIPRASLAAHLQRQFKGKRGGLGSLAGKALRTLVSGVAVYVAVNVAQGARGKGRIRQDLHLLQDKSAEAANVIAEKAQDLGSATVDATVAVKEKVTGEAERKRQEQNKGWGPFGWGK